MRGAAIRQRASCGHQVLHVGGVAVSGVWDGNGVPQAILRALVLTVAWPWLRPFQSRFDPWWQQQGVRLEAQSGGPERAPFRLLKSA